MKRVCVLGGGSFGTAMADLLARRGQHVTMWMRDAEIADAIQTTHHNPKYLSQFQIDANATATTDLHDACANADWILICTPSGTLRSLCTDIAPMLHHQPIVLGCKGLENGSLMTCAEVVVDVLGPAWENNTLALSGPSFAQEVMRQCPTAVVLACKDDELATRIAHIFSCETFRAYTSTDLVGVEMGGALKNVMAIAAGVVSGLGLGENARAALITRGIAEMSRLAEAKGGEALTLAGLSGVGDMLLTCMGQLSRNRALGQALGEGKSVQEALASVKQVAEGYVTAQSAYALAEREHVDAAITQAVYRVLYEGLPVRDAMLQLISRAPGKERRDY